MRLAWSRQACFGGCAQRCCPVCASPCAPPKASALAPAPCQASLAASLLLRDALVQLAPAEVEASLLAASSSRGGGGHSLPTLTPTIGGLHAAAAGAGADVTPTSSDPQLGGERQGGSRDGSGSGSGSFPKVPGILFKAAATIKEELVLCEHRSRCRLMPSVTSHCHAPAAGQRRGVMPCAALRPPAHASPALPSLLKPPRFPALRAGPVAHAPCRAGHNMISGVIDSSGGVEDGLMILPGVSEVGREKVCAAYPVCWRLLSCWRRLVCSRRSQRFRARWVSGRSPAPFRCTLRSSAPCPDQ